MRGERDGEGKRTERTIRIDGKIAAESEREREREGQKEAGRRWRRVTGNTYWTLFTTYLLHNICFGFKCFNLVPLN